MGLFSSDEDVSKQVEQLVENSNHSSVTAKKLAKKNPSIRSHLLAEEPLIHYLREGEQPHMIFHTAKPGGISITVEGEKKKIDSGGAAVVITDMRTVIAKSNDGVDEIISIPIEGISGGDTEHTSVLSLKKNTNKLILHTNTNYVLSEAYGMDKNEVDNIVSGSFDIEVRMALDGASGDDVDYAITYIAARAEEFRNIKNKGKVSEYIDSNEEVIQISKGKEAEIKQGEETESRYAGKGVYTVITDKRVFAVIGQRINGTDVQNLSYDSIDTVNLDQGMVMTYLSIDTGGRTYRFNIYDSSEAKKAVDYIRKRANGVTTEDSDTSSNSEQKVKKDTAERLEELENLHQQRLLSDEEYESKREEIVGEL